MTKQQEYISFIRNYIGHDFDAYTWTLLYVAHCHAIDDIVDGDKTDYEFIIKTFRTSLSIFSHHFYIGNYHTLRPLCETAYDSYRDSVCMERSLRQENWEKYVGDVIRQNANDVILAVILIVSGLDARNKAALELRKLAYNQQHDDEAVLVPEQLTLF